MKSVVLFLLLLAPQANPARIVIVAENQELTTLLRDELKKRRDLAVVEKDAEFVFVLTATKLESCAGYTASVMVADASRAHFCMFVADAPTLRLTIERAAARIDLRRIYPSTRH